MADEQSQGARRRGKSNEDAAREAADTDTGADTDTDADTDADADADTGAGAGADTDAGADADDEGGKEAEATTVRAWLTGGGRIPREASLLFGLVLPAVLLVANMWHVRAFTIDDSYISYRYARNLARGLGLVYNAGEHIEGYTNFLWTVLLAGGIKVGIDPDVFAKVFGGASALGALTLTYLIAEQLRPYRVLPCIATWLLASTIVFCGYAVFGLETSLFVCLTLGGVYLFFRESGAEMRGEAPAGDGAKGKEPMPWSGLVFGLAGLTRPEAPLFIGILMLFLGRNMVGRKNLYRAALFIAPVALHLAFRHSYYGTWVPNTASAKTGNTAAQIRAGSGYVQNYLNHAGPVVWLGLLGLALGLLRRRDVLALGVIAFLWLGYVTYVGGDWMPYFRFMAPFEPFCFLLVDVGVRGVVDKRDRVASLALAGFAVAVIAHRAGMLREAQAQFLNKEKRFWDMAAGGTARWFEQSGATPGELALGDIGYVGYKTDLPILDLLGLVDPVISKLPGGYTQKIGPGFADRFFDKAPMYALIISSNIDCQHPSVPGSQVIYRDRRFAPRYAIAGKVPLDGGFAWCIYKRKDGQ